MGGCLCRPPPNYECHFESCLTSMVSYGGRHPRLPKSVSNTKRDRQRLDLGQSNIAYERMCNAVAQLHHDPRILEKDNSDPGSEPVLLGTHLRDVFLRSFSSSRGAHKPKPFQTADDASYAARGALDHPGLTGVERGGVFKDDLRIQSWARRYSRVEPIRVEGDPELNGLNATQIRAVAMMVGERISLIHGVRIFTLFFSVSLG
jgi:hypothetical protein